MSDFLFTERGRRTGEARIERALRDAVRAAGLTGPDGAPLHVTAHMLRHTYATALASGDRGVLAPVRGHLREPGGDSAPHLRIVRGQEDRVGGVGEPQSSAARPGLLRSSEYPNPPLLSPLPA